MSESRATFHFAMNEIPIDLEIVGLSLENIPEMAADLRSLGAKTPRPAFGGGKRQCERCNDPQPHGHCKKDGPDGKPCAAKGQWKKEGEYFNLLVEGKPHSHCRDCNGVGSWGTNEGGQRRFRNLDDSAHRCQQRADTPRQDTTAVPMPEYEP